MKEENAAFDDMTVSDSGTDFTDNVRQPIELDISEWSDTAVVGLAVDSMNGKSSEGNPELPYYTIAGFSEISTNGVYANSYTLERDENSIVITANADIRANAVFVTYDGTGKAENVSNKKIVLNAGCIKVFDVPSKTKVYIFEY